MADEDTRKDVKSFDFKPIEAQYINVLQQVNNQTVEQNRAVLSNFLSFVALERLGYKVTQNTNFKLNEHGMEIWEEEPPAPEVVTEAPKEDAK